MKLPSFLRKPPKRSAQAPFDPVKPDAPFSVIGDVHGRFDLLQTLVSALPKAHSIICVGDLVDRGDQSADVLRFVKEHPQITALMGNHEAMLLNFLQAPDLHGPRWLRHGGMQTLASFGVFGATETSDTQTLFATRDALFAAMGEDLLQWLFEIDCIGWSGNIAVVHAGADPNLPLHEHDPDTFIWGHPDFHKKPRKDGFWVVHGHTIVSQPKMKEGRISIDTGAYATGQLTAAVFTKDGLEFMST